MADKKLNILHLYPDLLNLYGDKGNIACLEHRLKWRGIGANVLTCTKDNNNIDFDAADIVFLGGGSDREQELVCGFLKDKKDKLSQHIEDGGTLVAVCGGYQMLGSYYKTANAKVDSLGILDIYTDFSDERVIGNVVIESELVEQKIVGFENHAGITQIGDYKPLGKVLCGGGNTGKSGFEGLVYKNVVATYLHGPLFPKNPKLCDYLLERALKHKYVDFKGLEPLDDTLENQANEYIEKRFLTGNE